MLKNLFFRLGLFTVLVAGTATSIQAQTTEVTFTSEEIKNGWHFFGKNMDYGKVHKKGVTLLTTYFKQPEHNFCLIEFYGRVNALSQITYVSEFKRTEPLGQGLFKANCSKPITITIP